MRCSGFEKRLSAFLNGDLSVQERAAAVTHLESCPDCRQTTRIERGDLDLKPEGSQEDFVSAVLEVTSGATCRHARDHLCDLVDGELNPEYSKVVAGHLQTCKDCKILSVALKEVAELLPAIALLEPDPEITGEVLARTAVKEEVFHPSNRIRRCLDSIFKRPRFSWEAAYIGTLIFMALWGGVATSDVAEGPSQKWASTQLSVSVLAEKLQQIAANSGIMDGTEELNQELTEKYVDWKRSAVNSLADVRRQIHGFPGKSGEYLEQKLSVTLKVVSGHLQELRESLGLEGNTVIDSPGE